jgi:hypothetical protein
MKKGEQLMNIPVVLEPLAGNGYRASGGPFGVTAEGATEEETLAKLRELIEQRLAAGARLVELEVKKPKRRPWTRFAGTWRPDDPFIERWKQAVEEYRQKMDEDPTIR